MGEIGEVYAVVIARCFSLPYNLDPKVRLVYDLLLGNNIRRGIGRILEIASLARLRPLYVIRCAYRHFSRMSGVRASHACGSWQSAHPIDFDLLPCSPIYFYISLGIGGR